MVTDQESALNEALSAVMDGQATPADWARVRAAWDQDPGLRERWALWHTAADGLRAAELLPPQRDGSELLATLHARIDALHPAEPARRGWWAPLAVAASFVALSVGLVALRPESPEGVTLVQAQAQQPPAPQGLAGLSFSQAAARPTLAAETPVPAQALDWGLTLPERAASAAP